MKTDQELQSAGFTESGVNRYKATVTDYCDKLFENAVALGKLDKAPDALREEITYEHVRTAAVHLAIRSNNKQGTLQILCQVGEYLCAVAAGVGGGKLDQTWGVAMFGIGLTIGVILFVIRNTKG